MSRVIFKVPDLGEGTIGAEIIAWHIAPGDLVQEDQALVELMTEKATVEVPSPVSGRVISRRGEPGETVAVGAELVVFETEAGTAPGAPEPEVAPAAPTAVGTKASPATRRRAREAGIDLGSIRGSGPEGRIVPTDLTGSPPAAERAPAARDRAGVRSGTEEIQIIGLRRQIAQRLSQAAREIPHFSHVEEVDVTELECLRQHLIARQSPQAAPLSYVPFVLAALARVLTDFPQCNATYDAARGVLVRHRAVHAGIAVQGPDGLVVPVVRHAESLPLEELATEIGRLAQAVRNRTARREELSGSTITLTSLGKLGGLASTPLINPPEVAIVGVNRAVERPVVLRGTIAVRRIMNLSSSFDHRFIDGYDAAAMIQALRDRLEHPAMIFRD